MIEVRYTPGRLDRLNHDTLIGEHIVSALRAANIPVNGYFALSGVKHGELSMYEEQGVIVFRWRENDQDREINFQVSSRLRHGQIISKSGRHLDDDEL